jgi:hypothetical protein
MSLLSNVKNEERKEKIQRLTKKEQHGLQSHYTHDKKKNISEK